MQIVPMRDLKNTVEIEKKAAIEPVFVTKNGYGRLVVMDIDYYQKTMQKMDEAAIVLRGLKDYEEGRVADGKSAVRKLRDKYGV